MQEGFLKWLYITKGKVFWMAKSKTNCRQSGCPIAFTLDAIGDKWSLLIVRDIIFKGRRNFSEFLEAKEKISTNILSDRLRNLELNNIISKTQDPENGNRNIYNITQKGMELIPIILEIVIWGTNTDENSVTPNGMYERLKLDKQNYIAEIIEAVKNNKPAPYYLEDIEFHNM